MNKVTKKILSASVHRARYWSNTELQKIAPLVRGDVINVSGWQDNDKQGKRYRDYFIRSKRYVVSNFDGWRGISSEKDLEIDLSGSIDRSLQRGFDCVYNHTTLEHIYEVRQAFGNLCALSRDLVIVVVPAVQPLHGPEDGDFWRFSPYAMRRLFSENHLNVVYERFGPKSGFVKYLFYVGSKQSDKWLSIPVFEGTTPMVPKRAQALPPF